MRFPNTVPGFFIGGQEVMNRNCIHMSVFGIWILLEHVFEAYDHDIRHNLKMVLFGILYKETNASIHQNRKILAFSIQHDISYDLPFWKHSSLTYLNHTHSCNFSLNSAPCGALILVLNLLLSSLYKLTWWLSTKGYVI